MSKMTQAALWYLDHGMSVIPVGQDKRPLIPWKEFQERKPTKKEIETWWSSYPEANLAVVTGAVSDLFIIDIDTEEGLKEIRSYFDPDTINTPTVKTPKGTHFWFRNESRLRNTARCLSGIDTRGEGGYCLVPPSKNGNGKIYVWDRQRHIRRTQPMEIPHGLVSYIYNNSSIYKGIPEAKNAELIKSQTSSDPANKTPTICQHLTTLPTFASEGQRDEKLFHFGWLLYRGGANRAEIEEALANMAALCSPPFPPHEMQAKVESIIERAMRKERNLTKDITEWITRDARAFTLRELYAELGLTRREDQNKAQVIIGRLKLQGKIEPVGSKMGVYRMIDRSEDVIDFADADSSPLPIFLPFDLHELVHIQSKNILIYSGEYNAGKTAMLLNTMKLNLDVMPCYYFSSEMGGPELKARLEKFDMDISEWPRDHFISRSQNFADVIRPNAINLIDFMEVHKEHYIVGEWIRQIYDKLDQGICVIALQKPKGRDEGYGGQVTLQKARLALAIEPGRIKIVKAKNWADPMKNPNRMVRDFKLVGGCKFVPTSFWRKEDGDNV